MTADGPLVVTGALGHIGSRLIRSIDPGRYEAVVLVDNLSTLRYCSLFDLPSHLPYRFVEADVCTTDLESLFAGAAAVVHLAAIADAPSSVGRRDETFRVNVDGTARVAAACAATNVPLLFPSTTSVYGTSQQAVDELSAESELKPQSPYAESKLEGERLLAKCAQDHGLRFATLRLGTIAGVSIGMRFHTAVNRFVWQACVGQPLTVWRTAMHQLRPYLELRDAVRAMKYVLANDLYTGTIHNVLTANASVSEIVEILRDSVSDLRVTLVDSPIMNQLSFEVRPDRFKALGFQYRYTLREAIEDTVRLLRHVRAPEAPPVTTLV